MNSLLKSGPRPAARATPAAGRRLVVPRVSLLDAIVKPITTSGQVRSSGGRKQRVGGAALPACVCVVMRAFKASCLPIPNPAACSCMWVRDSCAMQGGSTLARSLLVVSLTGSRCDATPPAAQQEPRPTAPSPCCSHHPCKSKQVGDLKKGIAQFYDESSGLWEEVWGEHMHHGACLPALHRQQLPCL
jgi:hypothetical protein